MKKTNWILVLCVVLTFTLVILCGCNANPNNSSSTTESLPLIVNENGLTFKLLSNGTYEVTGFDNSSKSISIPETINETKVTSIGEWAFSNCSSLTSLTIPNSVTTINDCAFSGCSKLTSITIPDSITSIGDSVFDGCILLQYNEYDNAYYLGNESNPYVVLVKAKSTDITSCEINSSTKIIYYGVFNGCSSLQYNEYDNAYYLGNESNPYVVLVKAKSTDITSCEINTNTKFIHSGAFFRCSSLQSITIPNSVISIGSSAFNDCSKLTSIIIPDSVTSIGGCAFESCSRLTSVTIPNSVTSIGDQMFCFCSRLTNVTIPDSVTYIGQHAFYGCSSLINITIPNSITSIDYDAFVECNSLRFNEYDNAYYLGNETNPCVVLVKAKSTDITSCEINANTKIICVSAFRNCSNLTSITIPNSVSSIGHEAFNRCSNLTSITIPDSVNSIGNSAFWDCSSLTSIDIPNSVTFIGSSAFDGCSSLTSIEIPDSVISIGSSAFLDCSSLTSVTIGNSVTSIGYSAFNGCYNLVEVYNLSDLTIEKGSDINGYTGYYALDIYNDKSIPSKLSIDGNEFIIHTSQEGKKTLVRYIGSQTQITIPSFVNKIKKFAFKGCDSLKSVTFETPSDWLSAGYILSSTLENSSTAATYLTSKYVRYDWIKPENSR